MKSKLSILIGLAVLCLPAFSQVDLSNATLLEPSFFFYTPGSGWGYLNAPETPFVTMKNYYWDGNTLGFDDEDTLVMVHMTHGTNVYNIESGVYKLNMPVIRNSDGSFQTAYLYRLNSATDHRLTLKTK